MSRSWGVVLLSAYLGVVGLLAITNLAIEMAGFVVGALAIGAAVALLLEK